MVKNDRILIAIDKDTKNLMNEYAKKNKITVSQLVREAVIFYMRLDVRNSEYLIDPWRKLLLR